MPTAAQASPSAPLVQNKWVVKHIKQHPGPVQVTRHVYVMVTGKHFPNLQPLTRLGMLRW